VGGKRGASGGEITRKTPFTHRATNERAPGAFGMPVSRRRNFCYHMDRRRLRQKISGGVPRITLRNRNATLG